MVDQAPAPFVALSVIPNPVKAGRVVIYSANSRKQTLALEQRDINGLTSSGLKGTRNNKLTPEIKSPSSIVSMLHNDMVHVYGVSLDQKILLLSPVSEPIYPDAMATSGMLAGCTSSNSAGETTAWLVYLGSYNNAAAIMVNKILDTSSSGSLCRAPNVHEKTRLAATHDGNHLWVVYMTTEMHLVIYNVSNNVDKKAVKDANLIKGLSTIAASFVPANDIPEYGTSAPANSKGRFFVYFLYKREQYGDLLYRSWTDIPKSGATPPDFSHPELACNGDTPIMNEAQMSVVVDKARRCNWIYGVKQDDTAELRTVAYADEWIST